MLLLVTAGLFFRTVRHAAAADPGFEPDGLFLTSVDLSMLGYDEAGSAAFFDRLLERAAGLPGVSRRRSREWCLWVRATARPP